MLNFSRERQSIAALQPILRLVPGSIPIVVCFGVATALFEGLGLSLFIPLFQSLTSDAFPSNSTILGNLWKFLFSKFSPEQIQWIASLAILALLTCKNGLLYLNTLIFSRFNWRISHQLRTKVFGQLLHVDSQFLMDQDAGKLMSILDKEAWQTTQALSTLATLIISSCTLIVFSGFLLLTSWCLTLLSLLLLFLVSERIQILIRQVKCLGQQAAQANIEFVGQGFESLSGLETIRQFGQQDFEQRRFEEVSSHLCSTFMDLDRLMGAIAPLSELAFAALLTCLLLIVLQGDTNLSVFLTFLFMLYRLAPQVKTLDAARANLVSLTASVQVVTDLMKTTLNRQETSGNFPFVGIKQNIQFRNVTFQYQHGDSPALQNLSFQILPGQTTAIVGPSGAGKSTMIGLILRQFEPVEGVIEVDGRSLADYDLNSWREHIAVVSQSIYLFNASIRDNIAYGQLDASEAAILAAARMADAHEFISKMPNGYDTIVGERGVRLSGGQRQRIALARCLVRDDQILILDEATNALDSLSEIFIQETLATVGRDRTVIIIAHRLSTIERADQVFVIDSGQLVEQGTVPQLMQKDGLFAQMYRLQSSPLAH